MTTSVPSPATALASVRAAFQPRILGLFLGLGVLTSLEACKCNADSNAPTAPAPRPGNNRQDTSTASVSPTDAPLASTDDAAAEAPQDGGSTDHTRARTLGPLQLQLEACALEGPPIEGQAIQDTIGAVARSTDGSVYILNQNHAVRRYLPDTPDAGPTAPCRLHLDTALGTNGTLSLGGADTEGSHPEFLHADQQGHVFVSSPMRGSWRLTGTQMDATCELSRGALWVSPDGTTGWSALPSTPPNRIVFAPTGCQVFLAGFANPFTTTTLFRPWNDGLLAGGADRKPNNQLTSFQLRPTKPNGQADGPRLGDGLPDPGSAPEHICWAKNVIPCGPERMCVLDTSCRNFTVFGPDRKAASTTFAALLSLEDPFIAGISDPVDGVAFATVQTPDPARAGTYVGGIYRIQGLR